MSDRVEIEHMIEEVGARLDALIKVVHVHAETEGKRAGLSESVHWCAIARSNLQQGIMALRRALNQPMGF